VGNGPIFRWKVKLAFCGKAKVWFQGEPQSGPACRLVVKRVRDGRDKEGTRQKSGLGRPS
jgi:hypothetical protein